MYTTRNVAIDCTRQQAIIVKNVKCFGYSFAAIIITWPKCDQNTASKVFFFICREVF